MIPGCAPSPGCVPSPCTQAEHSEHSLTLTPPLACMQSAPSATEFSRWTDAEILSFLDQRGGEHDDCRNRGALVRARCIVCGGGGGGGLSGGGCWGQEFMTTMWRLMCTGERGGGPCSSALHTPYQAQGRGIYSLSLPTQIERAAEVEANTGPASKQPEAEVWGRCGGRCGIGCLFPVITAPCAALSC